MCPCLISHAALGEPVKSHSPHFPPRKLCVPHSCLTSVFIPSPLYVFSLVVSNRRAKHLAETEPMHSKRLNSIGLTI